MQIEGIITEIFDTQQVSDKFKKRDMVVEYVDSNPQYPELIKLEFHQDKVELLNLYKVGERVEVHFNLRGRAWTNQQGVKNYFNTLQAWKISRVGEQPQSNQSSHGQPVQQASADDDEMPF